MLDERVEMWMKSELSEWVIGRWERMEAESTGGSVNERMSFLWWSFLNESLGIFV